MTPSHGPEWQTRPLARIVGMPPVDNGGNGGVDGGKGGTPPPPPAYVPDWAFRIRSIPGVAEVSDDDRMAIADGIRGELACLGYAAPRIIVEAQADVTTAFVWVNDPRNDAAAQRGTQAVPPLSGDELWRYFISANFFGAEFQRNWDNGMIPAISMPTATSP
jgi:hypothetical protein